MTMKGERILTTVLMGLLTANVTQAADSLAGFRPARPGATDERAMS